LPEKTSPYSQRLICDAGKLVEYELRQRARPEREPGQTGLLCVGSVASDAR
jgi:hypothetical protein